MPKTYTTDEIREFLNNFGCDIPEGAMIHNIEVTYFAPRDGAGATVGSRSIDIPPLMGGSGVWGASMTPEEALSADFGINVVYPVSDPPRLPSEEETAEIDWNDQYERSDGKFLVE